MVDSYFGKHFKPLCCENLETLNAKKKNLDASVVRFKETDKIISCN